MKRKSLWLTAVVAITLSVSGATAALTSSTHSAQAADLNTPVADSRQADFSSPCAGLPPRAYYACQAAWYAALYTTAVFLPEVVVNPPPGAQQVSTAVETVGDSQATIVQGQMEQFKKIEAGVNAAVDAAATAVEEYGQNVAETQCAMAYGIGCNND
ncbi:MAG: hypothetical protein F4086_18100 [Gemmatimonadetes bacterium]|nr:hypothetical protein [Dehalococcoidia bacterium]MYJ12221.1 hypothetical protein [Gemmatimonadota bacterium]